MRDYFKALVIFISLIFFFSCEEGGFMSPVKESDLVMTTLVDGSVVFSGETIPLSVTLFAGTYEGKSLSIDLQNLDGESLTRAEVGSLDEVPPVALPEALNPGAYRLLFLIREGDQVVAEHILQFFYTDTMPRISGISSYPLVLRPGARGIMELLVPLMEIDPWVSWSLEGQILKEGLLSEITPRLTVEAPDSVGAYTVRADFYPFAPPGGTSWSFSSPVYQETLLYVSNEIKVDDPYFENPDVFSQLFHFQGEYADWSGGEPVQVLTTRDDPVLDVFRGVFGYRMDRFSGFEGTSLSLPVTDAGRLGPFSLVFSFALVDGPPGGTIFQAQNETGDFSLIFKLDEEGYPVFEAGLGDSADLILRHPEIWQPGVYPSVTASVVPDDTEEKIYFLLYQGGELLISGERDWNREYFNSESTFSLGGDEGAAVILNEFGVYYRDEQGRPSPSAGMFLLDRLKKHGNRLLFVDGFDSPHLQEGMEVSEEARLRFSRLELSPQGRFLSPPLPGGVQPFTGDASLETGGPDPGSVQLQLWGTLEEESVLLAVSGPVQGPSVEWIFTVDQDSAAFNGTDVSREVLEAVSSLRLGLENSGDQPLFLKDVTILKENLRLSGQTGQGEGLSEAEDDQTETIPKNPA